MKCTPTHFLDLLLLPAHLRVPLWHRHFTWPTRFSLRLFEDILRAGSDVALLDAHSRTKSHFAGMITVAPGPDSSRPPEMLIVDGQQRLVTFVLILLALAHALRVRSDGIMVDQAGAVITTADEILTKYLYLPAEGERGGHRGHGDRRIQLLGHDDGALAALVEGRTPPASQAPNLLRTYRAFQQRLSTVHRLDSVLKGLATVHGATVELSEHDGHPAEIFVQLNTR